MKNKFVISDPTHWVDQYADYLYAFALARLEDEELCRDLVQETFLAALEKRAEFRGESPERTWLTAILKYKVIEVYRKRNSGLRATAPGPDPEQEFFEPDSGHWTVDDAPRALCSENADPTLRRELAAILQKCLKRLPALWQSIFSLKHLDDAATESICRDLKITPANFWVIIHRAKLNLRACLQKEGL